MKRIFILTVIAVLLGVANAPAQQIAVVSESGETTIYQTLPQAIEGASVGSVIYLPGGGFTLPDSVKITKRLTIIGIGHKSDNDNVDRATIISGNMYFNQGSSNSAVMGCYITGNIYIGEGGYPVNNLLIKYCNFNSLQVLNSISEETNVNQSILRSMSSCGYTNAKITNNLIHSILDINGGNISNNILFNYGGRWESSGWVERCITAYNSNIVGNIFFRCESGHQANNSWAMYSGNDNIIFRNMSKTDFGDDPINIGDTDWNDVFVDFNNGAISTYSDFHFKETYHQYSDIGVYANGVDFDKQIAPVPYIVAKRIAEETDAAGQLKIQVRVKAGE